MPVPKSVSNYMKSIVKKRWAKTTKEQRAAVCAAMNAARLTKMAKIRAEKATVKEGVK